MGRVRSIAVGALLALSGLLAVLAGCVTAPATGLPVQASPTAGAVSTSQPARADCTLEPVVVPTAPAEVPRYAQLDETTGLHVTGTVPETADIDTWRLIVDGSVTMPLSLTYDALRCMARMESAPLLVCPGFFEDRATWAGVPLRDVLSLAGAPRAGAQVYLYGADGYTQRLPIEEAMAPDVYLSYEWQGEPLPIIHGFPLRAVVPGSQGSVWVKWLYRIEVQ